MKDKGVHYPFAAWRDLRVTGTWIPTDCAHPDVYPRAGTDGENAAVLPTDCSDRDDAPGKEPAVGFEGFGGSCGAEIYLPDADHDLKLLNTQRFSADSFAVMIDFGLYGSVLIKVNKDADGL